MTATSSFSCPAGHFIGGMTEAVVASRNSKRLSGLSWPIQMQLIRLLDIPSFLVIGDVGSAASPLVELDQRLEVVQIKEVGHGIPYDQPERFSAHENSKMFLAVNPIKRKNATVSKKTK